MQTSSNSCICENGSYFFSFVLPRALQSGERTQFEFCSNFDSSNLGRVERIQPTASATENTSSRIAPIEPPEAEFNIWTKPDCYGTNFQNSNRTWFYFGLKVNTPSVLIKMNLVDLNRQSKMYSQGMAPVYKITPGKDKWERIRDKPTYTIDEENIFTLNFKFKTTENPDAVTFLAFTYPFSYAELHTMLVNTDVRYFNMEANARDDIYYTRETVCLSLEGRNVDLITISSYHNISRERETRLKSLFPDLHVPRAFRFIGKKVIFVSARVHPGETPSSFVFNGVLNLLLNRDDVVAITLRRLYVFKMIPMLNPDGVSNGHYRTDTRGVNLNRMYLNPSVVLHPSIYAARALIRYYHYGYEKEDEPYETVEDAGGEADEDDMSSVDDQAGPSRDAKITAKVSHMTLEENKRNLSKSDTWCGKCKHNDAVPEISTILAFTKCNNNLSIGCRNCGPTKKTTTGEGGANDQIKCEHGDHVAESGLFLYMDMHGHASKKGIFMYGNHFEDVDKNIECMLLPKIMSINNYNFHFTACNFTERNIDRRDGMSREGSGRVAVLKLTGLIRSYTLECNYNTGRIVNILPCTIKESPSTKMMHSVPVPPKYTPQIYEQSGRALGASILDLTGNNPLTRIPNSQFHTLNGLRDWLRTQCFHDVGVEAKYMTSKFKLRNSTSLQAQGKSIRAVVLKTRSSSAKGRKRMTKTMHSSIVPIDRKENICSRNDIVASKPSCSTNKLSVASQTKTYTIKNKVKKDEAVNTTIKLTDKTTALKQSTSKLDIIKEKQLKSAEQPSRNRIQLQEICFIKGSEGKRVIAKYKPKGANRKGSEDNLVVAWDATNNPQVFSHKTKGPGIQDLKPIGVPGPSKTGCFRVHNFAKPIVKAKRTKRPLRRLTATIEAPTKLVQLKKRKILKSTTT